LRKDIYRKTEFCENKKNTNDKKIMLKNMAFLPAILLEGRAILERQGLPSNK
jgi:hypothetical protein